MKAILIDPKSQTVSEVEHTGDYKDIYRLIDASPFDLRHIAETKSVVYFDDEFLLRADPEFFFELNGTNTGPIGGKGLILGTNGPDSTDTELTVEAVKANIQWRRLKVAGWTKSETKDVDHPVWGKTKAFIAPQPIFEDR